MIRAWLDADDGELIHQRLLPGLLRSKVAAELGLLLAAVLSAERLRGHSSPAVSLSWKPDNLAGFTAFLKGDRNTDARAILERTAHSFLRVLRYQDEHDGTLRLLAYVIDSSEMDPHSLDGISDLYWNQRLSKGLDHGEALEWLRDALQSTATSIGKSQEEEVPSKVNGEAQSDTDGGDTDDGDTSACGGWFWLSRKQSRDQSMGRSHPATTQK